MIFHEISKYIYKWLSCQPNVKEESLTDWLLYQASMINSHVLYKTFTRNEEANTGADWEWWILTDDGFGLEAYRLLIQAKKLKKKQDNYQAITYGNINGMQIDLLLSSANKRKALPLYAYYSCSPPDIEKQLKNFNFINESIIRWCENCINGVYLSSALSIRKNVIEQPKRKITDEELINNSLGLSLLDLFFKKASEDNNLFIVLDNLNKQYSNIFRTEQVPNHNYNMEFAYENYGFKYAYKDFPGYLKTIIEHQGKDVDWIESEYHYDLEDLSGIALIDTRV